MDALTIERPEVAAAAQGIRFERERLQLAFDDATTELESRIAERASVDAHYQRLMLAAGLASQRIGELNTEVKSLTEKAILKIVDNINESSEPDGQGWEPSRCRINFRPLEGLEPAIAEVARGNLFLSRLGFHIEADQELCKVAHAAELSAEGDQAEALANVREYELNLSLTVIAETEGQLIVDRSQTATGELRKRAAGLRLQAAGIHEQIAEQNQKRKGI